MIRPLFFLKRGELLYFMRLSYVPLISNFRFYLARTYSMSDVDWPNLIKSYRGGQSTTIDPTTVSMNGQGTWHNKLFLSNLFLGSLHRNEPMDARYYKPQLFLQYLVSHLALGLLTLFGASSQKTITKSARSTKPFVLVCLFNVNLWNIFIPDMDILLHIDHIISEFLWLRLPISPKRAKEFLKRAPKTFCKVLLKQKRKED